MRLRPRIRADVLSGFLGSGKTTLLRAYLGEVDSSSIALVINEFGAVAIDHRLLRRGGDSMRVLSNGCACCGVAEELRSVLLELLRDDASSGGRLVDRVLIETSGLADPASILGTLQTDETLAEYVEPGSCVVTFDALDGVGRAADYPEVRSQLAVADAVILTKADLASPEQLRAADGFVAQANPLAARRVAGTPGFRVAELFAAQGRAAPVLPRSGHAAHAAGVQSFCLSFEGEIDWASFSIWLTGLLNRHGERILRFKGILETPSHARPLVIHGVRHLVYPPQHPQGVERRGRSDLVFIVDGLEPQRIEASLRAFLGFSGAVADAGIATMPPNLERSYVKPGRAPEAR